MRGHPTLANRGRGVWPPVATPPSLMNSLVGFQSHSFNDGVMLWTMGTDSKRSDFNRNPRRAVCRNLRRGCRQRQVW